MAPQGQPLVDCGGGRHGGLHGGAHTSVANVALPYMAGNLGSTNDESTWVLTSYLASNAIVLPASAWLAGMLGRKRFFMMCLVVFTLSSLLCGFAPSLGALILFRVLQGAGGGGLQPMSQAILADTFPPEKRGLAFALYGITVVVAPVGPTLGGWITDKISLAQAIGVAERSALQFLGAPGSAGVPPAGTGSQSASPRAGRPRSQGRK